MIQAALLCYPMHGTGKMLTEGYRTRDAHLIEWFGRLIEGSGPVTVFSRPTPVYFRPLEVYKERGRRLARNTLDVRPTSNRIPPLRDRRRWWVVSTEAYPSLALYSPTTPVVIWNPLVASIRNAQRSPLASTERRVHVDLLDDWTLHFHFSGIQAEIVAAYRRLFERADSVTANSEGTLELAHRFGRTDAVLVLNGCDPEVFKTNNAARGAPTIGYVGKIGKRLDLGVIESTVAANPAVRFVFAGPILDAEYRPALSALSNVELLGDVHYSRLPELLTTFDIGWIPHNVGAGEVGGDVIKTYEYRAAHLPVLATPFRGVAERGLDAVTVLPGALHARWISDNVASGQRVPRVAGSLPEGVSWQHKARVVLESLHVADVM